MEKVAVSALPSGGAPTRKWQEPLYRILAYCFAVWWATVSLAPSAWGPLEQRTLHETAGFAIIAGLLLTGPLRLRRLLAFLYACALLAWFLRQTPETFGQLSAALTLAVFAAFVSAYLREESRQLAIRLFTEVGMAAVFVTFLLGISGHMSLLSGLWGASEIVWHDGPLRWTGTATHPNLYAFYIALVTWAVVSAERIPLRMLLWLPIAGYSMVMTFSRNGWVVIAFLLLLALGLSFMGEERAPARCRRLAVLLAALGLGIGAVSAQEYVFSRFARSHEELDTTPKWADQGGELPHLRRYIYPDALELIMQRPVAGYGLGGYMRNGKTGAAHAHNIPLEIGVAGGFVGLAFIGMPLALALARRRNTFATGVIVLTLACGLVDCYVYTKWPAVILGGCVGMALRDE